MRDREVSRLRAWGLVSALVMAILMLVAFSLPAGAASCQTLTFDDGYIVERSGNTETVRTGLVGSYLWVQLGEYTGQDELEGTVSHEISPQTYRATVCDDGSVTQILDALVINPPAGNDGDGVERLTPDEAAEVEAGGTEVPESRIAFNFLTFAGLGGAA